MCSFYGPHELVAGSDPKSCDAAATMDVGTAERCVPGHRGGREVGDLLVDHALFAEALASAQDALRESAKARKRNAFGTPRCAFRQGVAMHLCNTVFPSQTERSGSWRLLLHRASDHQATM